LKPENEDWDTFGFEDKLTKLNEEVTETNENYS